MLADTLVLSGALCWLVYTGSYKILQPNIMAVSAAMAAVAFHGSSLLAMKTPLVLAMATALSNKQSNAIAGLHLVYCCFRIMNPSMSTICAAAAHFIAAQSLLNTQTKQAICSALLEALFINTYRYVKLIQTGNLEAMQTSPQHVAKITYQWNPTQKFSLLKAVFCVHWQRITMVSFGLVMLKLIPYYQQFTLMQLLHSNSELYVVALRWIALNIIEILLLHVQEEKNQTINTIVDGVRMDVYFFTCKVEYSQETFNIDTAFMHISNFRNVLYSASDLLTNTSAQLASILFIAAKLGWLTAAVIFTTTLFSIGVSSLKFQSKQGSLVKPAITPQVIMDNIRTIKHYAWESKLCNLVDYNAIPTPPKLHLFVNAILDRVATYGPKVVTSLAVLYGADKLSYAELSIILYDISVLSNYMENFKHIPESIAEYIEFEKYVNIPLQSAKNNYIKHKPDAKSDAIVLDSCSFSWGPFTIQPLSLVVKQGSFVTVEGKVGGGKSSLMAALCGEMPLVCGNGAIYGKISYVGQKPWIMNATFRDNIVFGKEFDEQKYQRIIYACALYEDIQLLPFNDMSEIGRRGVNLSGGQKARLALARAIYNDADVYVLDDVLSAVDTQVESHLIDHVLNGMLKDKTRILVTHAEHVIYLSDMRLLVDNGKVSINHTTPVITKNKQIAKPSYEIVEGPKPSPDFNIYLENSRSDYEIVWKFIILSGFSIVAITMIIQFAHSLVQAHISSVKANLPNKSSSVMVADIGNFIKTDLLLYFLATELQSQAHMIEYFWAKAAVANMQKKLMRNLLYSKITFIEKLSKSAVSDLFSDIIGPAIMAKHGLVEISQGIFNVVAIISKHPFEALWVLFILLLPVCLYRRLKSLQISIMRKSNQCGLKHLAQCNDMEDEIMDGRNVLRIYGRLDIFLNKLLEMGSLTVMINKQSHLLEISLMAASQLIQTFLSLCILTFIKWKYVIQDPGYIEQIIKLAIALFNVFKAPITANIGYSLLKIGQYLCYVEGLEQESSPYISGYKPKNWLSQGIIEFKNYSLQYRPDLPLVLQNLSFTTKPGEKIGIVGRTGAGKSSLTFALLRLVEAAQGSIYIDGIDISTIGLHDLRSSIAMVPQDPMILPGTIRDNLDPGNEYNDAAIQLALEKTGIWPLLDDQLDTWVDGTRFSAGQRQLLSLSRALLWNRKIVILDEATANIDSHTDQLIQQLIRQEFAHSTVLTIAHRLNTVMDSDRILVMNQGHVVEFDTPQALLQQPGSLFKQMVDSMNYNKQELDSA